MAQGVRHGLWPTRAAEHFFVVGPQESAKSEASCTPAATGGRQPAKIGDGVWEALASEFNFQQGGADLEAADLSPITDVAVVRHELRSFEQLPQHTGFALSCSPHARCFPRAVKACPMGTHS